MTKFSEEYLTFKRSNVRFLDMMGDEVRRGHVVAYSKPGETQRNLNLGVVSQITKEDRYSSTVLWFAGRGYSFNRMDPGINGSIIIIHNPLYNLNSNYILTLFEETEEIKGKEHGDLLKEYSFAGSEYHNPDSPNFGRLIWKEHTMHWKNSLPQEYEFGVPLDEEQMISIIDDKKVIEVGKLKRARRMKARGEDGKYWGH